MSPTAETCIVEFRIGGMAWEVRAADSGLAISQSSAFEHNLAGIKIPAFTDRAQIGVALSAEMRQGTGEVLVGLGQFLTAVGVRLQQGLSPVAAVHDSMAWHGTEAL